MHLNISFYLVDYASLCWRNGMPCTSSKYPLRKFHCCQTPQWPRICLVWIMPVLVPTSAWYVHRANGQHAITCSRLRIWLNIKGREEVSWSSKEEWGEFYTSGQWGWKSLVGHEIREEKLGLELAMRQLHLIQTFIGSQSSSWGSSL